jgi:hypothetical protein
MVFADHPCPVQAVEWREFRGLHRLFPNKPYNRLTCMYPMILCRTDWGRDVSHKEGRFLRALYFVKKETQAVENMQKLEIINPA